MRSTDEQTSVRLYYLDAEAGAAQTLFYGPLSEALRLAEAEPEDVQDGLFIATDNDVVAFVDLREDY